MEIKLIPTGYPEDTSPANVKAWADHHNHVLIGAYLRKYADLFTEMSKSGPSDAKHVMPLEDIAYVLDEIAWEIEGEMMHQRQNGWGSHITAHDLMMKCFNDV